MLNARRITAWAVVTLFVVAAAVALWQPVFPNHYAPRTGLDWWKYPLETNAPWRLPSVSENLNDLAIHRSDNGAVRLWAVGDRGAIVHSDDGGLCWAAQGPWRPLGAARVCGGPTRLLHQQLGGLASEPTTPSPSASADEPRPVQDAPLPDPRQPSRAVASLDAKTPFLIRGDDGEAVLRLRDALGNAGIAPAAEASAEKFDQALFAAVRQFQTDAGLLADGMVGPVTWEALLRGAAIDVQQQTIGPGSAASASARSPAPNLRAVHFFDADTGWAAGEDGTVLATTDGGANWQRQVSNTDAGLLAVQFLDAKTGWAVGDRGTVLATTDGGAKWQPQVKDTDAVLFAVQFLDADTGWAVGGEGTVLATTNGGASWQPQVISTDAYLFAVQFLDTDTGWAVGTHGTVLATTDGGASWQRQVSGTDAELYAVQFLDAATGWAVGSNGTVLATTDGGASWQRQVSGTDADLYAVQFLDAKTGWAVVGGGTVLATTNGGTSWQPQASGSDADLNAVQFRDAATGWAVGDRGTVLATTDGGASWLPQVSGTDASLGAVQFLNAAAGWAVGYAGTVLATTNGGASWQPEVSGTDAWLYAVQFLDARTGWAVGDDGTVLATTDGGASWQAQVSGTDVWLYAVKFLDAATGWAVGDVGTVLATTDGGTSSWQPQVSGTPASLRAVQFLDADTGWAVGRGGTVLATSDGGASWQTRVSGTDADLNAVQFRDAATGWAVGERGTVLATTNGGASWQPQPSGTDAWLYAVQFLDAATGWAVGSANTVLATKDGGKTWASPLAPYAIAPAPWFWLATVLGMVLLGFTFVPPPPRVTERRVADLLASDRPLRGPHEADALGLGAIAASLSEFLRNGSTEAPLTIAVTGDWGSGKTSLMNLLRRDLADNAFRPVWFNAWHHQKGEQILASLFAHIREQSIPPASTWRGLRFRWRLLVHRGAPAWLLVALLVLALGVSAGYVTHLATTYGATAWDVLTRSTQAWHEEMQTSWRLLLAKLVGATAAIVAAALGLIRTLQGFGLDPQRLVTVNPQHRGTQGLDPGARARFTREFRDVTECLKPRKMVIFIDDLDRCGKDSLIEVLEAVNFLASSGDCFIVLGMSPRWVESCVGLAYDDLAQAMAAEYPRNGDDESSDDPSAAQRRRFARNYLEKLINIEVPIPVLQPGQATLLLRPDDAAPAADQTDAPGLSRWPRRILALLVTVLKPALVIGALGAGLYVGSELLRRPDQPAPPQPVVHWRSSDVRVDAEALLGRRDGPANGGAADRADRDPAVGSTAAGDLTRSLSELLGVEISLQATRPGLPDELVLFEGGADDQRWRIVLGKPTTPPPDPKKNAAPPEREPAPRDPDPQPDQEPEFRMTPGLATKPSWHSAILPLLLVALAFAAWHSSRREAAGITEDSSDFRAALATWLPWLMARQGTPRAVKRFVNKLRYIAIRLRHGAADAEGFPEPNTVALAAIGFFDEDWISDAGAYEKVVQNRLDALLTPGAGPAADLGPQATAQVRERLCACIREHAGRGDGTGDDQARADRPYPWPPTPEHRAAFLAVLAQQSRGGTEPQG